MRSSPHTAHFFFRRKTKQRSSSSCWPEANCFSLVAYAPKASLIAWNAAGAGPRHMHPSTPPQSSHPNPRLTSELLSTTMAGPRHMHPSTPPHSSHPKLSFVSSSSDRPRSSRAKTALVGAAPSCMRGVTARVTRAEPPKRVERRMDSMILICAPHPMTEGWERLLVQVSLGEGERTCFRATYGRMMWVVKGYSDCASAPPHEEVNQRTLLYSYTEDSAVKAGKILRDQVPFSLSNLGYEYTVVLRTCIWSLQACLAACAYL